MLVTRFPQGLRSVELTINEGRRRASPKPLIVSIQDEASCKSWCAF